MENVYPNLIQNQIIIFLSKFKTVAKFCNSVVAATLILVSILVPLVLVTLQSSETNTKSTKIGIKNDVAATTVLQNFATVLN